MLIPMQSSGNQWSDVLRPHTVLRWMTADPCTGCEPTMLMKCYHLLEPAARGQTWSGSSSLLCPNSKTEPHGKFFAPDQYQQLQLLLSIKQTNKLTNSVALSYQTNYNNLVIANFCCQRLSRGQRNGSLWPLISVPQTAAVTFSFR
jgi:hypothetical protein